MPPVAPESQGPHAICTLLSQVSSLVGSRSVFLLLLLFFFRQLRVASKVPILRLCRKIGNWPFLQDWLGSSTEFKMSQEMEDTIDILGTCSNLNGEVVKLEGFLLSTPVFGQIFIHKLFQKQYK
ncbi:hypothetical protein L345_04881, partial [Ophiophagus hannah]